MTDPKNSARWKREKNCKNSFKSQILKERSKYENKEKWDEMCRQRALSSDREESLYWYFRHVKVASESKSNQDPSWRDAFKTE
jgi:hypothetical protein